jgi:murein DD-endopeptidase MepM/ murein hydrolase activator NlpD
VRPGQVVEPGTLLGWSGNTGNARTTAPHLHFGISLYGPTKGEISPYPYLQTWPREAS